MTNYRERFDSHLAEANSEISNAITDFDLVVPNLRPSSIKRLLAQISRLLGRLDREGAKFPEFLVDTEGSIPEQVIQEVANIRASLSSGAEQFINSAVYRFAYYQKQLEEAISFRPKAVQEVKSQQVRELQSILLDSQTRLSQISSIRKQVDEQQERASKASDKLQTAIDSADKAAETISRIRQTVERLAAGDARGKDSIERLVRSSRQKMADIEAAHESVISTQNATIQAHANVLEQLSLAETSIIRLSQIEKQASEILYGATQAGLAGAYKTERDRLAKEQKIFSIAFYFEIAVIVVYAAVFLFPVLSKLVESTAGAQIKVWEAALGLFFRAVVISPVIWALLFTNRRYLRLETLQMDYAAKAVTALAYSGYRDELAQDPELSVKLKDGLVARFLEHPERLLNAKVQERVQVLPDGGLSYVSSTERASDPKDGPVD